MKTSYWWDFGSDNTIIVESDNSKFPVVAKFIFDPVNGGRMAKGEEKTLVGSVRVGQAEKAIDRATWYIKELECGRANPRIMKIEDCS